MHFTTVYSCLFDSPSFIPHNHSVVLDELHQLPENPDSNSLLVLHGGSDIHPSIYGKLNGYSHVGKVQSYRDVLEQRAIDWAVSHGIPILGICRGAQLLCAKAGGTLVQDVTDHHNDHRIYDVRSGASLVTNSCHHQMMVLKDTDHVLVAITSPARSKHYLGEYNEKLTIPEEPEVVYFPRLKGLAVQGHPEWMSHNNPFVKYCLETMNEFFYS